MKTSKTNGSAMEQTKSDSFMPEEEPSVSDILSSIRQVLSKENNRTGSEPQPFYGDNVVELTPAMRCDGLVSETAAVQTRQALQKLADVKPMGLSLSSVQVETELRPLLKEWLDANLPAIVEDVVAREVRRVMTRH